MRREVLRWAVKHRSENKLDGVTEHWEWDYERGPVLFHTRREARKFIESKYGYIRIRPDLRAEPHGWRLPRAVKVAVILKESR